jgi:hypothetical protein
MLGHLCWAYGRRCVGNRGNMIRWMGQTLDTMGVGKVHRPAVSRSQCSPAHQHRWRTPTACTSTQHGHSTGTYGNAACRGIPTATRTHGTLRSIGVSPVPAVKLAEQLKWLKVVQCYNRKRTSSIVTCTPVHGQHPCTCQHVHDAAPSVRA